MSLRSTLSNSEIFTWRDAVLRGLAPDGGLFMPVTLPQWTAAQREELRDLSFAEFATRLAYAFLSDEVPRDILENICHESFNFPLPLEKLDDRTFVLELFHGPTCAFKDFGARFMARLFRYFWGVQNRPLTVLAATSGDTGSAVANAFFDSSPNPPIRVTVLFPRNKISVVQRKQMTTLGHNITALEVDGTFDDCQALVKRALRDETLLQKTALTSANSINIARLLPQMFYYAYTSARLSPDLPPIFSVPSGNLGNLTGGLFAHLVGFSASHFIAACNANRAFPDFLTSSEYRAAASKETISNAMDVGDPSNFHRIASIFGADRELLQRTISGFSVSDDATSRMIHSYHTTYRYILDPHTAVGACALESYRRTSPARQGPGVILATAHPAKFSSTVAAAIHIEPEIPTQLRESLEKPEFAVQTPNSYEALTAELLSRL